MYIAIDGDDIGSKLEKFILENDETKISFFSVLVNTCLENIKEFFTENNLRIILNGGDSLLCEGKIDVDEFRSFLKNESNEVCFSVGFGGSIRESYLALKYAKSFGKDCMVIFNNQQFEIVHSGNQIKGYI